MRYILFTFVLSSGLAAALTGSTPAVARLYAQPNPKASVVATLSAKTKVEIQKCSGGPQGWCSVTVLNTRRAGFIPRAQLKASGNCTSLIAAGMGDLLPHEASYTRTRDRDDDGLGCDTVE